MDSSKRISVLTIIAILMLALTDAHAGKRERFVRDLLASPPPGAQSFDRADLDRAHEAASRKGTPLLVLVRYPAVPADQRTLDLFNQHILSRYLTGDSRNRDLIRSEDWATYSFVRSTYLALQLFKYLEARLPKDSVGIMPVALGYDGSTMTVSYPFTPPAATVYVDASAITHPNPHRSEFCSTCGPYIRPLLYITTPSRTFAANCLNFIAASRHAQKNWSIRQLNPDFSDPYATYWMPMDIAGFGSNEDAADEARCSGGFLIDSSNGFQYKQNRSYSGNVGLHMLPAYPTTWIRPGLKKAVPDDFLDERLGYPDLGGYAGWIYTLSSQEALLSLGQDETSRHVISHYEGIYKIANPSDAAVQGKIALAANAERIFYSRLSSQWVGMMMEGDFGKSYREMLAREAEIERSSNKALLGMLLTAGLTGFTNATSGKPLDLSSLYAQSQSIAIQARSETDGLGLMLTAQGRVSSDIGTTLGADHSSLTASSLDELRRKIAEILSLGFVSHPE